MSAVTRIRLPATFVPTHQTAGLPGYPAVDVFAPAGSIVEAGFWGRVSKVSGHPPTGHETPGGAYGLSVYVHNFANGLTRYVTHMASRPVRVGSIVKPGTVLGTVARAPQGSPHGSEHVHLGLNRRENVRRLLAVALVALAAAAPAHAYYADGGSGGNRPDCTIDNVGDGFGNWLCGRDAFTGDTDWVWWG